MPVNAILGGHSISSEFIEVVIPAFNGEDLIKDCISSVAAALPDSRITVVNDCSSDRTSEIVSKEFPNVNIINNEGNIGFGQSCNVGSFQSDRDWVLLLNQDANLINVPVEKESELVFDITSGNSIVSNFAKPVPLSIILFEETS